MKPDGSIGSYTLPGNMCIGHTRYPTSGSDPITDAQPVRSSKFGIAMAHNGQINDVDDSISAMLEANSLYPRSKCDVELLLHSLKDSLWKEKTRGQLTNNEIKNAVKNTMESISASAYSAIAIIQDKMVAFRDPMGIKPFVYGTKLGIDGEMIYGFASESLPLTELEFELESIKDIPPGGVAIYSTRDNTFELERLIESDPKHCVFEFVYFSDPSSVENGLSVSKIRSSLGQLGAEIFNAKGYRVCLLYTSPSPRDRTRSRMPSSA